MKRGFGSDNHSGISPEVLRAIADANDGHALAYGVRWMCSFDTTEEDITSFVEVLKKLLK